MKVYCLLPVVALAASPAAWSQARGYELVAGQFLKNNEYLVQTDRKAFATMQGDGNLCIYNGSGPKANKGLVWCSGHAPGKGDYFAMVQGDANLCVFRGTGPGNNKGIVWCSGATGPAGPNYRVILQQAALEVVALGGGSQGNGASPAVAAQMKRIWTTKMPAKVR